MLLSPGKPAGKIYGFFLYNRHLFPGIFQNGLLTGRVVTKTIFDRTKNTIPGGVAAQPYGDGPKKQTPRVLPARG